MYYDRHNKRLGVGFGDKCRFCKKYKDNTCTLTKCFENLVSPPNNLNILVTDCEYIIEQEEDNLNNEFPLY